MDKAEIRTALQNWQKGILLNESEAGKSVQDYGVNNIRPRSSGDGKSAGNIHPFIIDFI